MIIRRYNRNFNETPRPEVLSNKTNRELIDSEVLDEDCDPIQGNRSKRQSNNQSNSEASQSNDPDPSFNSTFDADGTQNILNCKSEKTLPFRDSELSDIQTQDKTPVQNQNPLNQFISPRSKTRLRIDAGVVNCNVPHTGNPPNRHGNFRNDKGSSTPYPMLTNDLVNNDFISFISKNIKHSNSIFENDEPKSKITPLFKHINPDQKGTK